MGYKIDVLILYSESDNKSTGRHSSGWVSNFQKFLNLLLHKIGKPANILLKSEHDQITASDIHEVAVIVPVLSQSFISSDKNIKQLAKFIEEVENDETQRIFKVLKHPLSLEVQPEKIGKLLPYELFFHNPITYEISEFKDFFSEEAEHHYWMKMADLAYGIYESLHALQNDAINSVTRPIHKSKVIYLAETSPDLTVQRNNIKRELLKYGYKILPENALPENANELTKFIQKDLQNSELFIHLIGNTYGKIPPRTDKSIVEIQNQLSLDLCNEDPFKKRLVWIPTNISQASDRQLIFIEKLKRENDFSDSAGIFQTSLEEFKNIIRKELLITKDLKNKVTLLSGEELLNGTPSVYLIHDKVDELDVKPFIKLIKEAGFTVLTPSFEGRLLDIRQVHIHNLQRFDAAIIYQNKVDENWVKMKVMDLRKAPGFGRYKPMKGKALISEQKPEQLRKFISEEITLISGEKINKKHSLQEFLKSLEN